MRKLLVFILLLHTSTTTADSNWVAPLVGGIILGEVIAHQLPPQPRYYQPPVYVQPPLYVQPPVYYQPRPRHYHPPIYREYREYREYGDD